MEAMIKTQNLIVIDYYRWSHLEWITRTLEKYKKGTKLGFDKETQECFIAQRNNLTLHIRETYLP